MNILTAFFKKQLTRLVSVVLILGIFWLVQLPELSKDERSALAANFDFARLPLAELKGYKTQVTRGIHPGLDRHSVWTSSVGAAVALNDLDRDGLSNDVCYVDPRVNQVIIAPVPGTGKRYEPFALDPNPLPYDRATMAPMGCLPGDLNEDGLTDVLAYYWGRTPIIYLQKPMTGQPATKLSNQYYQRSELLPGGQRWFTNASTIADLDGDGHQDLVIGNYYQDGARILDVKDAGHESMQQSMSRAKNGGSSRFFLWAGATRGDRPTVQFKESPKVLEAAVAHGWTLAVGAADLDGDLLPEVYFANDFGPDRLLHNRSKPGDLKFALLEGRRSLTTPRSKVIGQDSYKGMGVDFGDINKDGLMDIYVSNIASEYALEEGHFLFTSTGKTAAMQQGLAPYVEQGESLGLARSGWAWESKFGDFDNDGTLEALQATGFAKGTTNRWPELHELAMGNDNLLQHSAFWPKIQLGDDLSGHQHNPFFVRAKDGRYYDLAKDLGIDTTEVSRGIATADVDGDGDLDFTVANQWEPSYFYRNNHTAPKNFLGIHLLRRLDLTEPVSTIEQPGHASAHNLGQPAIGATAIVHLPDGQQMMAQVDGGNGHSGARSPDLHFGLGEFPPTSTLQVDLQWRDIAGHIQRETIALRPGWHTIILGNSQKEVV